MRTSMAAFAALWALSGAACASAPQARATESACRQSETIAERRADLVRQRDRAQVDAQEATRRQSEAAQPARTGAATSEAPSAAARSGSANFEKSSVSTSFAEVARLDREIAQLDGTAKSLPTADACRAAGLR